MIHVCIVGLGLIGGSLGMALRRVRHRGKRVFTVHGWTRSRSGNRLARKRGAVDHVSDVLSIVASAADIVVLATPVQFMADLTREILPSLKRGAILTDVGSVKKKINRDVRTILRKRKDLQFVGAHPLAGSEKSGISNAHPKLFDHSVCVITTNGSSQSARAHIEKLWRAAGSHPISMSDSEHDKLVASTSHLPHLLAFSLFSQIRNAANKNKNILRLTATSFREMTRIAGSEPALWAGIFGSNRMEIHQAWRSFQKEANRLLYSAAPDLEKTLANISSAKHRWTPR